MSDPGLSSVGAYQSEPRADASSSDIPLWVVLACIGLMVAGAGLVAWVLEAGQGGKHDSKPSYPSAWDPRIAPYVKIVEKQRGLTFLHPVAVRFLPPETFEKGVTADEKKLDKDAHTKIEQTTGMMRALGLITGDVDLFSAFNDAHGSGTLAYYSFDDQRVTIRGTKLTPSVRATLVHELTHALQDQRFRIGERTRKLQKEGENGASTTEQSVLEALIEGDAERVATQYRESLTPKQRKAVDASEQAETQQARAELNRIPKVVLTMIDSPYLLGEAMVQAVAADGGNHAVDSLFLDTPTHESALLDPFQVLSGDTGAEKVAVPKLGDGERSFSSGELGVLTWYFMLAERLPLTDALAAADGWGGDAYVAFQRSGVSCARIAYAGDTPADTTRMFGALQRWTAAAPGSPTKVTQEGDQVLFESCDPGKAADVGKDASEDALTLVATRTYLGVGILRSGGSRDLAHCVALELAREYPVSQLTDPAFAAGGATRARVQQIAAGCR